MHELYELKEMLCKELEEYGKKGELTTGSHDVVDKLAHTIKNIDKIIEAKEGEEGEYSGYGGGSYRGGSYARGGRGGNRGGSYAYAYDDGSYARGRGRNARRDSMGRYSREGYSRANEEVVEQLHELMEEVPEDMKYDIKKMITKMEAM